MLGITIQLLLAVFQLMFYLVDKPLISILKGGREVNSLATHGTYAQQSNSCVVSQTGSTKLFLYLLGVPIWF